MQVFVTGATGFIGSAIVRELLGAGHRVLALARSDVGARALADAGADVLRGELADLDSLRRGAAAADGVIHTAFVHDFRDLAAAGRTDLAAVEAFGDVLAGSDRPLLVTSGSAVLAGGLARETDAPEAGSPGSHRVPSEHATLALAARGVRAMVIRLPPSVHDDGDHGFVPALIAIARATGVSAYVDDGLNRWAAVHRLDAARLYRLALERGAAGARYHGIGEEGIATRTLAAVIGRRLGVPVVSKSRADAAAHFGWLAHFFGVDAPATSALTQAQLGWTPTHPGLLADVDRPAYFAT